MASAEDQPHTGTDPPEISRAEDLPHRVLLKAPEALTIPISALGVEAGRDPHEVTINLGREALSQAVSGNLSRSIAGGLYGYYRLINVRRRIRQRTALYSSWLAFPKLIQAETFLQDHPRFGLNAVEAKAQADHARREADLRSGAEKGRYDLGPLEHRARLNRAREYIQVSEELDKLSWGLWALRKLNESIATARDSVSVG